MDDATSVLFDLPGFVVVECVEFDEETRRVVIMQTAVEYGDAGEQAWRDGIEVVAINPCAPGRRCR